AFLATIASLCVAVGMASAVDPEQGISIKLKPTKAGTTKKPAKETLTVETTTKPGPNDGAFATQLAVIHFAKGLVFGGATFPSCTGAQVQQDYTQCPKGSQVGSGKATGVALGQTENLTVTAFNGPKGKAIELYVQGSAPLQIQNNIEGTLKKDTGKYGYKLNV